MTEHVDFIRRAIELAHHNAVVEKVGGPFGCVIVEDGEVIAEGVNQVLSQHDPTSHGEIVAIRAACQKRESHHLSGCTLYTSCEPCPMCYAAAWWARIDAIYYAATIQDAKEYGNFDDVAIYQAINLPGPDRPLPAVEVGRNEMLKVWKEFHAMSDRLHY
jgi:guanine deaminase